MLNYRFLCDHNSSIETFDVEIWKSACTEPPQRKNYGKRYPIAPNLASLLLMNYVPSEVSQVCTLVCRLSKPLQYIDANPWVDLPIEIEMNPSGKELQFDVKYEGRSVEVVSFRSAET